MGDRGLGIKAGGLLAAVVLSLPAAALAQSPARGQPPPEKPATPFGLPASVMEQLKRLAEEAAKAQKPRPAPPATPQPAPQAPAQQPAQAAPAQPPPQKPPPQSPPPKAFPAAAAAAYAPTPAAAALPPKAPPPKAPPPGGVDWQRATTGLRRSADFGPRAVAEWGLDPAVIDRTALPILLPQGTAPGRARIYSFGDYYTITANLPGARVSLSGTAATTPVSTPLAVAAGPEQLVIQRTVDGQLASFSRFGVLYTAEIRCDSPADPRCRSDQAVRDLVARSTVVVMGRAARQAAGLGG